MRPWQALAQAAAAAEVAHALTFRPRTRARAGVAARVDACHPEAYRARLQERAAAHSAALAQRQVQAAPGVSTLHACFMRARTFLT